MKKQHKFVAAALVLVGIVGYLMVTGMRDSMVYYYTPDELLAKVASDRSVHEIGVKVGGRVVPGTVRYDPRTLDLRFQVVDIESGRGRFPVQYQGPLPDTFQEGRDVVVEGRYNQAGTFEATTVLTKCGSRYEAVEEELRA
ncbi:MAG TPA: cytochrome c maturation protein CcmE [Longimicrobiaceae bacterium]|nr:cytochrome c maturation protein CcmE [Longimicrobiaceae bacterium]